MDGIIFVSARRSSNALRVRLNEFNGNVSKVPYEDISEIQIGSFYKGDPNGCYFKDSKIILKDGRSFEVDFDLGKFIKRGRYYLSNDPITGKKTKQSLNCKDVVKIKLVDKTVKFPPDYLYDPYTGRKL